VAADAARSISVARSGRFSISAAGIGAERLRVVLHQVPPPIGVTTSAWTQTRRAGDGEQRTAAAVAALTRPPRRPAYGARRCSPGVAVPARAALRRALCGLFASSLLPFEQSRRHTTQHGALTTPSDARSVAVTAAG